MAATPQVSSVWADNRGMAVIQLTTALNATSISNIQRAGDSNTTVRAYTAGADGLFNTADDVRVPLTVSYSATKKTVTTLPVSTSTWTTGQGFRLKLTASAIKSTDGISLDGEFNGETTRSGNGTAGGDFQFITRATDYPIATFRTIAGNINVRFFSDVAPKTVENFLYYANHGLWDNTFTHRSIAGFIVQGGAYTIAADGSTPAVSENPSGLPSGLRPLPNETGLSNVRGTMAMAKLNDDPDSATCQWFFNLADNSTNLDAQNGGFAVFAAVTDAASLTTLDALAKYPTDSNNVPYSSSAALTTGHKFVAKNDLVLFSRVSLRMNVVGVPTITTTTSSPSYKEASAPVVLDSGITVRDAGNQITGAVIQITSGTVAAEDMLGITPQSGILWKVTKSSGLVTLTLSGTASAATYQAILRTLTYANSSTTPSTAARTITISLTDSLGHTATAVKRVASVIRVNTAPTLTSISPLSNCKPGQARLITFAEFKALTNLKDVDTPDTNNQLRFKVYSGIQGTLSIRKSGKTTYTAFTTATPVNSIVFGPGDVLKWTPPTRWTDWLGAFGVIGFDGSLMSRQPMAVYAQGPRVQTSATTLTYKARSSPADGAAIDSAVSVFSSLDVANLTGATIRISGGYQSAQDTLLFTDTDSIKHSDFNASTGTLTLSGTATVAQYMAALRTVRYRNLNPTSPSTANRVITFTISSAAGVPSIQGSATRTIKISLT